MAFFINSIRYQGPPGGTHQGLKFGLDGLWLQYHHINSSHRHTRGQFVIPENLSSSHLSQAAAYRPAPAHRRQELERQPD
jgi:hypothetical protein